MTTERRTMSYWLLGWPAGALLAVLGATLLLIGAYQTTTSNPQGSCPAGSTLVAKFEFRGGTYVAESNTGGVVVNGTATGGTFTSNVPISAVVIKGGTSIKTQSYDPPTTSGSFSNQGLAEVGSGNVPDISNVQFCGPTSPPPTTTTTQVETTTTVPDTSTTVPDTSTTVPDTSTTVPGTSTTVPGTSTSVPGTSTTIPGSTTVVSTTTPLSSTTSSVVVAPPTTPPGSTAVVAPLPPPVTSTTIVDVSALPSTGKPSVPLMIIGGVLLVAGITMTALSVARSRRVES